MRDPVGTFSGFLELAPLMALVVDAEVQVVGANRLAADFWSIDPSRLPVSLLEVTRESRLAALFELKEPEAEVRLVHRRASLKVRLVAAPEPGLWILFMLDQTRLRQLETVRSEFVANLTHELKTPITSLRLAAESLLTPLPEETRVRFAQRVVREADHLAEIIDNLRQLAELESGPQELEETTFGVLQVVMDTLERLGLSRQAKLFIAPEITIRADRGKFVQAISNLIDNAAKFGVAASPMEISAQAEAGKVRVTVRDHGPGIPPEHTPRVFERFYKVDPSRTRAVSGSGLGLSIARHLVLGMGGRIWTEPADGGGQIFGIELNRGAGAITSP